MALSSSQRCLMNCSARFLHPVQIYWTDSKVFGSKLSAFEAVESPLPGLIRASFESRSICDPQSSYDGLPLAWIHDQPPSQLRLDAAGEPWKAGRYEGPMQADTTLSRRPTVSLTDLDARGLSDGMSRCRQVTPYLALPVLWCQNLGSLQSVETLAPEAGLQHHTLVWCRSAASLKQGAAGMMLAAKNGLVCRVGNLA